jgi:hypothetical protein
VIIGKDEMVLLFTLVIVISKVVLYRLIGLEVIKLAYVLEEHVTSMLSH